MRRLAVLLLAALVSTAGVRADEIKLAHSEEGDRIVITAGDKPVATYVFSDKKILRPYFAHIHAPDGTQVTRHHPPRMGIDAVDHDTMHPGIWLAFGDLSGADFWRNKGSVRFKWSGQPAVADGAISFDLGFEYVADDTVIGRASATHSIRLLGNGYLLTYHSRFSARDKALVFGDQEEMGLGMRLATPLVVKGGSGTITNSAGGKNETEVWGKQADWCDYSGIVERPHPGPLPEGEGAKRRVGMLLIPHKDNFRRSWFHVRDYGLMVANPFGKNAFTKGEKSRIEVQPGERLDLRFGVWIYSTAADHPPDFASVAKEYHRLAELR
jgi:hypothetical protein